MARFSARCGNDGTLPAAVDARASTATRRSGARRPRWATVAARPGPPRRRRPWSRRCARARCATCCAGAAAAAPDAVLRRGHRGTLLDGRRRAGCGAASGLAADVGRAPRCSAAARSLAFLLLPIAGQVAADRALEAAGVPAVGPGATCGSGWSQSLMRANPLAAVRRLAGLQHLPARAGRPDRARAPSSSRAASRSPPTCITHRRRHDHPQGRHLHRLPRRGRPHPDRRRSRIGARRRSSASSPCSTSTPRSGTVPSSATPRRCSPGRRSRRASRWHGSPAGRRPSTTSRCRRPGVGGCAGSLYGLWLRAERRARCARSARPGDAHRRSPWCCRRWCSCASPPPTAVRDPGFHLGALGWTRGAVRRRHPDRAGHDRDDPAAAPPRSCARTRSTRSTACGTGATASSRARPTPRSTPSCSATARRSCTTCAGSATGSSARWCRAGRTSASRSSTSRRT